MVSIRKQRVIWYLFCLEALFSCSLADFITSIAFLLVVSPVSLSKAFSVFFDTFGGLDFRVSGSSYVFLLLLVITLHCYLGLSGWLSGFLWSCEFFCDTYWLNYTSNILLCMPSCYIHSVRCFNGFLLSLCFLILCLYETFHHLF